MRIKEGVDCRACFAKYCECECKTCTVVRERNDNLSSAELMALNLKECSR